MCATHSPYIVKDIFDTPMPSFLIGNVEYYTLAHAM